MNVVSQNVILLVPIGGLLAFAAIHDVAVRTVPNWVSIAIVLLGLALQLSERQLVGALSGFALLFTGSIACWSVGWLGGGDAKLLPAAALAVAPHSLVAYVLAVSLAGGVLACLYLALGRLVPRASGTRPGRRLPRIVRTEIWRIRRGRSLPYACAIAAAAFFAMARV